MRTESNDTQRVKLGYLLGGWVSYWGVLAVATLSRPALMAWKVSRPNQGGSISAGLRNSELYLTMARNGQEVFSRSASPGEVAAWVTIPPLLMLGTWILLRSRKRQQLSKRDIGVLGSGVDPMAPVVQRERENAES
jgi:hypothetical protein